MRTKVAVMICVVLLVSAGAYAFNDGDFQVWHTESQEKKITKNSKVTLEEEFRFGDDASDFYYHHYDAGLIFCLNKNLDFSLNYRQVYEEKKGKFKEENRPHMNATVKWNLGGLKIEDRNRLQYRHFDYQGDFWQYRNKFTLKSPWKFTKIEITPYLADEIFLNFEGRVFNRNRFYIGTNMSLAKNVKAEVFYLLQTNRSSNKWVDANVLGTKIKLAF